MTIQVEDASSVEARGNKRKNVKFVDVAPKAFLQIRHAAGISSREYADVLGEFRELSLFSVFARQIVISFLQAAPTCTWTR